MSNSQSYPPNGVLSEFAYNLGRSSVGRLFVAALVASASLCCAYVFWNHQHFASLLLTVGVCTYGLQRAWRLLPFSLETRIRWMRQREESKAHPAYQYCNFLWMGIGLIFIQFWQQDSHQVFSFDTMLVPGSFILVGAGCYFVCHRFVARTRASVAHHGAQAD